MRRWKYSANTHSAFMSDDNYFGKWSRKNDMYTLYDPIKGNIVCMVDRKELIKYCQDNDLNCYTYLLYLFERYIDKYNEDDYYHIDNMPDDKCIVKVKDNTGEFTCGNCHHLIFKDYKERTGSCRLTRLYRRFSDLCTHEEEMS